MPDVGGNLFLGVPFPVVIGDRYIHIGTEVVTGTPLVDVYRWDRSRSRLVAEVLRGRLVSGASPVTAMPVAGAGAVRLSINSERDSIVGYASGGVDPRTVIARPDRIEVLAGDRIVAEIAGGSFVGLPIGVILDDRGLGIGASLPTDFPDRRLIEGAVLLLTDLVTPSSPVIDATDFSDCRLLGPALAVAFDGTSFLQCTFVPRTANLVLSIPDVNSVVVGAVGLRSCRVTRCSLEGIAVGVPPEQRTQILGDLGVPGDA